MFINFAEREHMQRSFQLYRAYAIIPGQLEQGMNETKKLYACYVLAKADAGIARSLPIPFYASYFVSAKGGRSCLHVSNVFF